MSPDSSSGIETVADDPFLRALLDDRAKARCLESLEHDLEVVADELEDGWIEAVRRAAAEGDVSEMQVSVATLLERATRRRATGADKALAARFLYLTGADDPAEPLAY